jgi:hypothetical protein
MPVSGKHSIGIIGFAANEAAMLEIFFNSNKAKGFYLVPAESAESLLIGISDASSRKQVEGWLRQNGNRPFIAVVDPGTAEKVNGKSIRLTRPLSMGALQQALADLRLQLGEVSTSPAVQATSPEHPLESLRDQRTVAFAEWQARKERSSQALSAWKGGNSQRQTEALRSRFSLERNELNSLILDAQNQLRQQHSEANNSKSSALAMEAEPQVAESLLSDELQTPRISAEMIQQCCGNLPDVNLDSATERRRVYFSLDGLLLPWIMRCIEAGNTSGKPQQVVGVPGALFYLPADKEFLVTLDADLLLQLTRTRFGFEEISLLEREPDAELPKGRRVASDELLWQLALFTARGRLPDTLSAEEPRLLNSIPDFERLLETPHARSIAELWQSQKLSAQNIASMLGVPQRFVFSFLVAADAIGLYCP